MKEKDVFAELAEMRRAFNEYFVSKNPLMMISEPYWRPPMDIFDLPDSTLVRMEIAGMDVKDIEIKVEGNQLVIRGQRRSREQEKHSPGCCRQMEIKYTNFQREVFMPRPFDSDSIQASYSNGFLEIRIPVKKRTEKASKVSIKIS